MDRAITALTEGRVLDAVVRERPGGELGIQVGGDFVFDPPNDETPAFAALFENTGPG